MIVELNPSLEQVAPRRQLSTDMLEKLVSEAVKPRQRYNEPSLPVVASNLPAGQPVPNYMGMLSGCYNCHLPVCLNPHDMWFVVLCEVATTINAAPELYRSLFTSSPQKVAVATPTAAVELINLDLLLAKLEELVPSDTGVFFPKFSTSTPQVELAFKAAFADAVQSYYNYGTFMCGLPAVELGGTAFDWHLLASAALAVEGLLSGAKAQASAPQPQASLRVGVATPYADTKYFERVALRATAIATALEGGDTSFVADIFTQRNVGSGGEQAVTGWIQDFYLNHTGKLENFNKCVASVPYTNLTTGRQFTVAYGCFGAAPSAAGALQGQYGSMVFERDSAGE
jgi:hypothetical protein